MVDFPLESCVREPRYDRVQRGSTGLNNVELRSWADTNNPLVAACSILLHVARVLWHVDTASRPNSATAGQGEV